MGDMMYGQMAYTLAVSIRYADKNIPIHLAWAGTALRALDEKQRKYFTSTSEIPRGIYHVNGKDNFIRAKLFLYDLSPFDTTIFMDVDTIFFKQSMSKLFDELKDVDFTITNEGYLNEESEVVNHKYSFWANTDTLRVAYLDEPGFSDGKLYMCRSEFIYFKKNQANEKYFELAKDIYDNPRVDVIPFANGLPDEFAFNVSGRILHHYPHKDNFSPIFWEFLHKPQRPSPDLENVYDKYYAYSIGGNVRDEQERDFYNNHVKYYFKRAGLPIAFLLTKSNDKKDILREREKL